MNGIEISVFVNRIEAVCDEMGVVLRRCSFSSNIKDRLDFSCAIFDQFGGLVAQAAHIPVHLGSMAYAMEHIVATVQWQEGDMLILNDPYSGGTHLPDITVIAPIFYQGQLTGFVANRAHHANIGATTPGSMPLSTRLEEEGVLIEPQLIVKKGQLDRQYLQQLLRQLSADGSLWHHVMGDFSAQLSANQVGVDRALALVNSMGLERFLQGIEYLNQYGERIARHSLSAIADGEYCFQDYMDGDGVSDFDDGIAINAKVVIRGSQALVDFAGTHGQVTGNINCPLSVTAAAVFYVFRCLMPANTPACAGTFRCINIKAPEGCLLNARHPAAVAAGNVETSTRIVDVICGALAQALPRAIPAASHGSMNNIAMGASYCGADNGDGESQSDGQSNGQRSAQQDWHYYETVGGGMGAGPDGGGLAAVQTHMTNTLNTPIESVEMHYPLRIRRYSIRPESGGQGQRCGGHGAIREYEFLTAANLTLLTERRRFPPWGLQGGGAGLAGENYLNCRAIGSKVNIRVAAGDRVSICTAGGGGWGNTEKNN